MPIISTEEQTNQTLISTLSAFNIQPASPALTFPPTSLSGTAMSSSTKVNQHADTIATLAKSYPVTTVKINSILRKRENPSIPDEGSCEASTAVPNT